MTTTTSTLYTRMLGARLLSEANDLKRTTESLAAELGLPVQRIRAAIEGGLPPAEYRELFALVADRYPIAFGRLWVEPTDTHVGVRHMTAVDSEATSRIFERKDRTGALTPYYEYRDTAMSRLAPFRPEWIRELRVVTDPDPNLADVAYNHGHFLHQTTLFIGPVNFYWDVDGRRYSAELNTGDSNYMTPFRPHSFTSRDGVVRVAVELRDEARASAALLRRHLQQETLSESDFADEAARLGVSAARTEAFLAGRLTPSAQEIAAMATALNVSARDLMPPIKRPDEEVIVQRRQEAACYAWPDTVAPCYRFTRLVRSRQQPHLKTFLVEVVPGRRGTVLSFPLHQYIYNYSDEAVRLRAKTGAEEHECILAPGDSAYVMPMVQHAFEAVGPRGGELYVVRVQGDLHADAVFELSGMAPAGLTRAAAETTRWF